MLSHFFVSGPAQGRGQHFVPAGRQAVLWPPPLGWSSILRGAAVKAGLDGQHTILCHLAAKLARRDRIPLASARNAVNSRISAHVGQLVVEFGLDGEYATSVANRVYWWLDSLDNERYPHRVSPSWPSPTQWLAIDRGAAAHAGWDGRLTLSTQFAQIAAGITWCRSQTRSAGCMQESRVTRRSCCVSWGTARGSRLSSRAASFDG